MQIKFTNIKSAVIFTAVIFLIFLSSLLYNSKYHIEKETYFLMDTYVTITALGPKEITSKAVDSALKKMREIDVKFNALNPESPIYAFNHDNAPLTDPEIIKLVKIALEASKLSDGAFDITVAPLSKLWGFYSKEYHLPNEREIKDCLNNVGYKHLLLNDGKLTKDNDKVNIDLGGIAKGYALIEAVKVLKEKGVTQALIDAGGDLYALGKKDRGLWKIGIKHPHEDGLLGCVEIKDKAVMASGDYERFFIKDGKKYHHIFDPKTGYPTDGVSGVTVIYSDPILGQILAKMPFFMGPKKGLEMLEKISGVEAVIVTGAGEIMYSPGLKRKYYFKEV